MAFIAGIALVGVTAARPAPAEVDVQISVGIPLPPAVVFETQPQVVLIPQTPVYYVPAAVDYDMYRYGKYWYINQGGYWYRAKKYEGPFKFVKHQHLPPHIVRVPVEYRHYPLHPPKGKKGGKH